MEKIMVVDKKLKRRMGVICFLPSVAFLISLIYYIILLLPLTHGHHALYSGEGITITHYTTIFILLALSSIISASVLIYCITYLVKIKNINRPTKMVWILLLLAVPVSFILFWYFLVMHEPRQVPVYPHIG
jgi:hypothetical protein